MSGSIPELRQRRETDRRLSFRIYLIVILILIGLFITISIFMGMHLTERIPYGAGYYYFDYRFFPPHFFYLTGWIVALIFIMLVLSVVFWWYQWQLYKRRNEHIERIKRLKNSLSLWLKEKYQVDLANWTRGDIQLSLREQPRGTGFFILWVVLSYLFGLVGFILTLVVWYWLTFDYYIHEQGEIQFFRQLSQQLREKEITFNFNPPRLLPPRSMILYILLMIIPGVNLGWTIWWNYILFRDPNVHFENHEYWESQLEKITSQPETVPPSESPLEILKRRYARGEISREEFERMKEDLS